jgi:hypothetical protein
MIFSCLSYAPTVHAIEQFTPKTLGAPFLAFFARKPALSEVEGWKNMGTDGKFT